jgi:cell division protein FtsI (penicillin-binding protein 3)
MKRFTTIGSVAMMALSAVMLVLFARVVQLQLSPDELLVTHLPNHTSRLVEQAPRGDLRDRRGRLIASSDFGWRLFVDPTRFPDPPNSAIAALAVAADMDADFVGNRILQRIARNAKRKDVGKSLIRYVSVGSVLDDVSVDAINNLKMSGVHLERVPVRQFVETPGLESFVGLVGVDDHGLLGAEHAFEDQLKPQVGSLRSTRDATGRTLWVEIGSYSPAQRGGDVQLSVDLAIQEIAQEELERGIIEAGAAGGRVIVVDPLTGEILAMADEVHTVPGSIPFDRDLLESDLEPTPRFVVISSDLEDDQPAALARNRCIEDVYEPGSTFKPFMWSAVTERGLLKPGDMIDTHNGRWRTPYGRPLEDVGHYEKLSWSDVLVHSSNIGMAQGVTRLSARQMRDAVIKLGFGSKTSVGLPGEASGLVTPIKRWSVYTQTSVAMGYEVAVTPVQMVRAFSIFARNNNLAGTIPSLRLTAADAGDFDVAMIHRVFPSRVALLARTAMKSVAKNMDDRMVKLGRYATEPRYTMFGKSGTANIPRPDGKGYITTQYISSFIAGAPAETPRVVVLVVIDDPGPETAKTRQHYGSYVAGPVVRRIVERTLVYLGVAPTPSRSSDGSVKQVSVQ